MASAETAPSHPVKHSDSAVRYGIELKCTDVVSRHAALSSALEYLQQKGIKAAWLEATVSPDNTYANIRLKEDLSLKNTVELSKAELFDIKADVVLLLDPRKSEKQVPTVSQKEILLALLHPGRLTSYSGADCGLEMLKDDVGVRQNTVAWTQTVAWSWPDGTPAEWNETYWVKGTPPKGVNLLDALQDMFLQQSKYSIGCYTAAKMALANGALDYYARVKKNEAQAKKVEEALWSDGDPLVGLEPAKAWYFEKDFDPEKNNAPGKILDMKTNISEGNFVPGDWFYILNPDEVSYQKTGYEGSNAIYLGMDRFSDYYNDHEHSYSYKQKINEVYQWRNGVFSRTRDADKIIPLVEEDYIRLGKSPEQGGLVLPVRLVPRPLASMGALD